MAVRGASHGFYGRGFGYEHLVNTRFDLFAPMAASDRRASGGVSLRKRFKTCVVRSA